MLRQAFVLQNIDIYLYIELKPTNLERWKSCNPWVRIYKVEAEYRRDPRAPRLREGDYANAQSAEEEKDC